MMTNALTILRASVGIESFTPAQVKIADIDIDSEKLWVNPDCGLKTRGEKETVESLRNLVAAAKLLRETEGQIAEDGQKSSKVKSA